MSAPLFTLNIDSSGLATAVEDVQRLRAGLKDRRQLHATMAVQATDFTRDYLRGLNRHDTAIGLGAKPTQHHPKVARQLESDSDEKVAIIRIPRSSGLGRAFHDVTIRPRAGKGYLTIPADKRTYGRRAREFPEGTFFVAFDEETKSRVLRFKSDGKVGYYLRLEVFQAQDRTLLPSDKGYRALAGGVTRLYVDQLLEGGKS